MSRALFVSFVKYDVTLCYFQACEVSSLQSSKYSGLWGIQDSEEICVSHTLLSRYMFNVYCWRLLCWNTVKRQCSLCVYVVFMDYLFKLDQMNTVSPGLVKMRESGHGASGMCGSTRFFRQHRQGLTWKTTTFLTSSPTHTLMRRPHLYPRKNGPRKGTHNVCQQTHNTCINVHTGLIIWCALNWTVIPWKGL